MSYEHINIPDQWHHYHTKYPHGMSVLEMVINMASQVNLMIDTVNDNIDEVQNFKDNILPANLQIILTDWEASGRLSEVLTTAILTGKANQADLIALQEVVDGLSDTVTGTLADLTNNVTSRLTRLTPPVTDYMTAAELLDIAKDTPLLNHTASIQAYVDAQKALGSNNLYFPKGNYRFKSVNLYGDPWNIYGTQSFNGYVHDSNFHIIADAVNVVGFISTGRYMAFSDFGFVSSGTIADGKNVTLYKNTLTDGQFLTARNIYAVNFSGAIFDTLDLIDTTIESVHTDYCSILVKVRNAGWSRSTTVTLRKLYCIYGNLILDMPNTAQSRMVDCIFENNAQVGNLANGQWSLDNVYLENNTRSIVAPNARLLKGYIYYNTPADFIENDQSGLSYIHWGESEIYHNGALFSRFSKHYEVSGNLSENNTGTAQWNKIGTWYPQGGGSRLQLEFLGAAGFSQAGGGDGLAGQTGKTICYATFTGNGNPSLPAITAHAFHEGSAKPVKNIKIVATDSYYNAFDIFVYMGSYASKVGFELLTTMGYFRKSVVIGVNDPGAANQNLVDVPFEFQIVTGTGSFKITNDGGIELTKPVVDGGATPATVAKYTYLAINGVYYKLPLYL